MPKQSVVQVFLNENSIIRRSPEVEQERAVAIYDLLESNHFSPVGDLDGPFHLHLRIEGHSRLVLEIRSEKDEQLCEIGLPLLSLRRIIRDYFQICESYYDAIKKLTPSQIEIIDMARRGLHNEGSEILAEKLKASVDVDYKTARRLFTLICVLHIRG